MTPDFQGNNWTYDAVNLWLGEQRYSATYDSPVIIINGTECLVDVLFKNTDNNATKAEAYAERMISSQYAMALVGLEYSSLAIPIGEIAQNNTTPMISTTATHPNVTLGRSFDFRMGFTNADQALVLTLLAKQALNATTAGIVFQEGNVYSTDLANAFANAWTAQGGNITAIVSFNSSSTDGSIVPYDYSQVKSADILFIPVMPQYVVQVANMTQEFGWTKPIIGGDGWDNDGVLEECGKACVGAFYSSMLSAYPSDASKSFVEEYNNTYGVMPNAMAALAYDSMNLIKQALINRGSTVCHENLIVDRFALRNSLKTTSNFEGVAGNITFNANNNPKNPCVDINIVSSKFTPSYYYSVCL